MQKGKQFGLVRGIRSVAGGEWADRVRARATARRAAAIRLIRLQRIQEFQQVTWPWSSPVRDFAARMSSSIRHLVQTTATRSARPAGAVEWQR